MTVNDERRRLKRIGDNIYNHMPEGMTQKELADRTGMTPAAISRIINGQKEPRASSLRRISLALRCSVDDLLMEVAE